MASAIKELKDDKIFVLPAAAAPIDSFGDFLCNLHWCATPPIPAAAVSTAYQRPLAEDESFDFHSSTLCDCAGCQAASYAAHTFSTFHFRRIESFANRNISASTAYDELEAPSLPIEYKSETSIADGALGVLQKKQSPLLIGRKRSLTTSKSFSLRAVTPIYSNNNNNNNKVGTELLVDLTATEALNMSATGKANGQRKISATINGRIGNTDINRNNGYLRNGTIMTSSSNAEKREHLYKILVIGELGTGKTSFIKRYVHQFFSQNYRATIGVDFALKVLHWDNNTIVRLQLWDIAGQERFGNMTRVYYKEAVGAFIVFDVTRSGTFDCVAKWKEDLDSKVQLPDGNPIPCILLANKCDQEKQGIVTTPEKMDEYVRENGFAGWYETSAKENINIDDAARALVNKILLNDKLISAADLADSEKFNLNISAEQAAADAKSKCAC